MVKKLVVDESNRDQAAARRLVSEGKRKKHDQSCSLYVSLCPQNKVDIKSGARSFVRPTVLQELTNHFPIYLDIWHCWYDLVPLLRMLGTSSSVSTNLDFSLKVRSGFGALLKKPPWYFTGVNQAALFLSLTYVQIVLKLSMVSLLIVSSKHNPLALLIWSRAAFRRA